jgi:hypothetical protein
MRWSAADIRIDLAYGETDHPIATLIIETPEGRLLVMGVPHWRDDRLEIGRVHVQAEWGFGPNSLGPRGIRALALLVMEKLDVRDLRLAGEIRTTGAGPGHRPRPFRFTRTLPP